MAMNRFSYWKKPHDPWSDAPPWAIEMRKLLERVTTNEGKIMSVQQDIKDALDKVTADVAAETTLTGSVLVFIKGLQDQILALANSTPDTTTAQALQALATQIEVNNKTTADAMVANTAPPPAPTPVPGGPFPSDPAPTPVASPAPSV